MMLRFTKGVDRAEGKHGQSMFDFARDDRLLTICSRLDKLNNPDPFLQNQCLVL